MPTSRRSSAVPARFAVSLFPEVFYALQVLADDGARVHRAWRRAARARLGRRGAVDLPAGLWPVVADALRLEPTGEIEAVLAGLEELPARTFQERLLEGALHHADAVRGLLDEGRGLREVVGDLPKAKREWLATIDLFPVRSGSAATQALEELVARPAAFRRAVVRTVRRFWATTFASTWKALRPGLERSVEEKRALFEAGSFADFARQALLPIEVERGRIRALRGGYELRLADVAALTFTPSAFNDRRNWTVHPAGTGTAAWFPYFEPDLAVGGGRRAPGALAEPAPDVALILRALGDTTRFALVSLLGREPQTAAELAQRISVSRATLSHHVHVLRSAGLVHETRHGGAVLLSLRRPAFERLSELLVARVFEAEEPVSLERSRSS